MDRGMGSGTENGKQGFRGRSECRDIIQCPDPEFFYNNLLALCHESAKIHEFSSNSEQGLSQD